jgi:type III pantothenate kinase
MTLLIDIGNTRLKLAMLNNGLVQYLAAIATDCAATCQQSLNEMIKSLGSEIRSCVAVSVGRDEINHLVQSTLAPTAVKWIKPVAKAAGVKNGYPTPSQLGADRWVSMIGVAHHFALPHPPIVLASFGTATTIDTLSPDNEFLGGLILPGVTMMHESLARGTANLPNAPGSLASFPTSTVSAITSGIAAAQVGSILRQVQLAARTYGQDPIIGVTGGARSAVASELQDALGVIVPIELPHIVLHGLAALAHEYKD